jgi:hypothetical protein
MSAPPAGRARRRVLLWSVLLLTVGAVVAAMFWPAPKRPTYEGKTVEELLAMLELGSGARADGFDSRLALIRMGAAAVPDLARILSERPSKWRGFWHDCKAVLRLSGSQPDPSMVLHDLKFRAVRASCILAENANGDIRLLIPQLSFLAKTTDLTEANRALASAGDEGISVLTNLLFTGDARLRNDAAWGLHHVKRRPQVISAFLRDATVETNQILRANALGYLRGSGAPAEKTVPLGLEFLRSEDAYTRWQAAGFLADYRSIDEVDKALEAATNDPDERVRGAATRRARR